MTQEEKELLIKDLSSSLPYGVIVQYTAGDGETLLDCYLDAVSVMSQCVSIAELGSTHFVWREIGQVKPYLRPMSSMSEEEYAEYCKYVWCGYVQDTVDYLNSIHVDYRGLIGNGLALVAPEEMYK